MYIIYQGINYSYWMFGTRYIDQDEREILHCIKDDKKRFNRVLNKELKNKHNISWEEIPYTKTKD